MDKEAIISWLLEKGNPAVRYYTLKNITDASPENLEEARSAIMGDPAVMAILSSQDEDGSWSHKDRFYTDKYHGTIWQLLILADLGADGNDIRIKKGYVSPKLCFRR